VSCAGPCVTATTGGSTALLPKRRGFTHTEEPARSLAPSASLEAFRNTPRDCSTPPPCRLQLGKQGPLEEAQPASRANAALALLVSFQLMSLPAMAKVPNPRVVTLSLQLAISRRNSLVIQRFSLALTVANTADYF